MESFKKWGTRLFLILLFGMSVYGAGRLYFHFTDGFTIGNISSDFPYDPAREVHLLSADQKNLVDSILSQRFTYLGKGCQSYVFLSQDRQYVLKFFKYQRFRTQPWLDYLSFIPWVERYRQEKIAKKQRRLNGFFNSWRIAFDELQEHTGLLYVHLNKTNHLNKVLTITDKMGFEHYLELDQMEFLLQKKVQMLGPYIKELMSNGQTEEAKQLITNIIELVLWENQRGLADNDHALMQNTGIVDGKPVHIDVGQFFSSDKIKEPAIYKQELFTKTFRFREWLRKEYPELAQFLEEKLYVIIGDEFYKMKPKYKPHEQSLGIKD